jgi:hypothetical protein
MNDPQNLGLGELGLGELGQRVQAMSDPIADSRLRPYQGAPAPIAPASNGRTIPPYEPLEDLRSAPPLAPSVSAPSSAAAPTPAPYVSPQFQSANTFPSQIPNSAANPVSIPVSNPAHSQSSGQIPASAPVYPWETVAAPAHAAEQMPPTAPSQPPTQPSSPAQSLLDDPNFPKSGLQRAINAVRSTLPFVTRLLPLLDGNFVTAVSALVAPQPSHHPPPPPVRVDLEPVERGLAEVRNSHRELRTQVQEQVTSLKRVEDQLERVREATDRNTLEQQEMVEDLRAVGSRVSTLAIVGLVLLLASLGMNVWFLIQLQHILR